MTIDNTPVVSAECRECRLVTGTVFSAFGLYALGRGLFSKGRAIEKYVGALGLVFGVGQIMGLWTPFFAQPNIVVRNPPSHPTHKSDHDAPKVVPTSVPSGRVEREVIESKQPTPPKDTKDTKSSKSDHSSKDSKSSDHSSKDSKSSDHSSKAALKAEHSDKTQPSAQKQ